MPNSYAKSTISLPVQPNPLGFIVATTSLLQLKGITLLIGEQSLS